ncbi:MAG: O-methyltransferase [Candidatus Izimaplasma sp.]|nr:O-methyltransferase [Candidatus Izimaplasma bacterium]
MKNEYLESINTKETNSLLVTLKKYAADNNIPIITDEGINFINQIIALSNVKSILEIGTAIGYSAINMALKNDVIITSIERNNEMYLIALKNVEKALLKDKIRLINEDALNLSKTSIQKFDLVFIDAAKAQSINFFNKFKEHLNVGGIIVTDNLLFHDLVDKEAKTRNLRQLIRKIDSFNKFVVEQSDFDTYLYQLGDGMSLSIKRK